jgi:hypothetical protein
LSSYATLTNASGGTLDDSLRLVLTDSTLPVLNANGRTGDYEPYFDIPVLEDGESATVRVTFSPVRAPLSFSLRLEQLASTTTPLAVVTPPSLTMNPNGTTPLAGVIQATTNIASRAVLTVAGAGDNWTVEFPEFQSSHDLPLLGLKPDNTYSIGIEFFDQYGGSISGGPALQAVTTSLPSDFPSVTVFVSQPSKMEPGFTLVDRFRRERGAVEPTYMTIFDANGDVVWYSTLGGNDVEQAPNGHLQLGPGADAVDIDMLGAIRSSTPLNAADLHHDLFRTEYGTFLSLTRTLFIEANYPTSDTDPDAPTAEATILDEPAVELGPNGDVLETWPMADLLDTTRIAYDSLIDSSRGGKDWVHGNAIVHDPRDDSILVSLRHQDAVVKFSRYSGELKWILGPHANWKPGFQPFLLQPVGTPFEWQYHQHAPMFTSSGTIVLFDNGSRRASPFDGNPIVPDDQNYTRAVEYAIDEENMEVTQVWEWGGNISDPIFQNFIGDADWLPQTGNVLIDFGGHSYYNNQLISEQGWGNFAIRVIEVTRETPAERVFDLLMFTSDPVKNVTAYRTERIPSLYPANVTVTDL